MNFFIYVVPPDMEPRTPESRASLKPLDSLLLTLHIILPHPASLSPRVSAAGARGRGRGAETALACECA